MMPTAPLKRRFAALLYELLLVGAVTVLASFAAGAAAMLLNKFSALASFTAVFILMAAWWIYFKTCWHKKGGTLPMQVWHIGLADLSGARPMPNRLLLRFMWACVFLVFIPLLAYAALRHFGGIPPKPAFGAALIWWMLPWGFALFHPDRQFLYDFLSGTRLVDLKDPTKTE